jgi:hypothetical protein
MPRGIFPRPTRKAIYPIGPSIAYIPLTRGLFSVVDWDDAAELEKTLWFAYWDKSCGYFYAKRHIGRDEPRQLISMQAFILGLYRSPDLTADHVRPGNGLDNRRANLRPATKEQQAMNHRKYPKTISGLKGAHWHKQHGYWTATISCNRKQMHLGTFATAEAAHAAYCAKAIELHGEFARLA